jgi:hypothetical protein
LNISIGSAFIGGNLTIGDRTEGIFVNEQGSILVGNGSSTRQPHVDIFDGGTDKCGYLVLYDETGVPFYIFVASTGELMIKQGQPSTCANNDGAKVGTQT